MDEPKIVTVTISERSFNLDLPVDDEKLIECVFFALKQYVENSSSIKVRQAYKTFSGTQEIITKVISRTEQLADWEKETKRIISALLKL